jgi:hypothetical protein
VALAQSSEKVLVDLYVCGRHPSQVYVRRWRQKRRPIPPRVSSAGGWMGRADTQITMNVDRRDRDDERGSRHRHCGDGSVGDAGACDSIEVARSESLDLQALVPRCP